MDFSLNWLRRAHVPAAVLAVVLWVSACGTVRHAPHASEAEPNTAERTTTVHVVSNGWHTGIILARRDLPVDRIPETADFPTARFVEFGWGDAEFYPANEVTVGMTLRAALTPTDSVMHVAGLSVAPERRYPRSDVVTLRVNESGLTELIAYIDASFVRGGQARAESTGPGLYRDSRFYPAAGRFHMFNTCNTWTAKALIAAGFTAVSSQTMRAESLMRQLRAFAPE